MTYFFIAALLASSQARLIRDFRGASESLRIALNISFLLFGLFAIASVGGGFYNGGIGIGFGVILAGVLGGALSPIFEKVFGLAAIPLSFLWLIPAVLHFIE